METCTTDCVEPAARAGTLAPPDLPFRLNGSQAKTAFALRQNCERMINGAGGLVLKPAATITVKDEAGADVEKFIPAHWVCPSPEFLNCCGFLTLTVGDTGADGKFSQVFDAAEASKRFNRINRRLLKKLFVRAIVVSERHKNGAIHFHLIGILRGLPDIRTGFDFAAFEKAKTARARGRVNHAAEVRYKLAASPALRAFWQMLRDELPKHGFGRAELTPIIKTGEAVACYVSKYIEKNICNRLAADKRKKLVRYIGDWKTTKEFKASDTEKLLAHGITPTTRADYVQTMIGRQIAPAASPAPHKLRPNDFGWFSKRAAAWRGKARQTAGLLCLDTTEDCAFALGPRWAWHLTKTWQGRTGDDTQPFLVAEQWQLDEIRGDLLKIAERNRPRSLGRLTRARWAVDSIPEYLGNHHTLLNDEIRAGVEDGEAEIAEFFEENLKLFTRKEGTIERFLRISERYDREETAWRKFEENQARREAALN